MINTLKKYGILTFVIYASGSIFIMEKYYNIAIPLLLVCTIISFFPESRMRLSKKFIPVIFFLTFLMSCTILLNKDWHISSYIAILCQFVTAGLVATKYKYSEFKKAYTNIIFFLAIVSLVCYGIVLVYPQFMLLFPKTEGSISMDHYNAFVYVFERAKGYNKLVAFTRNNGIFWEPGAYQAFLNVALLYSLEKNSNEVTSNDSLKILVFIATIITTFSVTGYIILAIILISHVDCMKRIFALSRHKALIFFITIAIIVAAIIGTTGTLFFSEKLLYSFTSGYFIRRLYLEDLFMLANPLNWFGLSFSYYSHESANSILHTAITLGIPFTITLLYMYYKYLRRQEKRIIFALVLIISLSTESLFWRPFFLCLAAYGLFDKCGIEGA